MSEAPPVPRVLVIDDSVDVCEALTMAVRALEPRALVECLHSADAAPQVADAIGAHAAAIDLVMPGADPLAAIRAIAARVPGCGVLVVSGHAEPEAVLRAVEAGAIGYVTKDEPPAFIAAAILAAARGEATFSKGLLGDPPAEYPGR